MVCHVFIQENDKVDVVHFQTVVVQSSVLQIPINEKADRKQDVKAKGGNQHERDVCRIGSMEQK